MSNYLEKPPYCDMTGKVCYDKRGALTAKNSRWQRCHLRLRIYECPFCGYWHLTSHVSRKQLARMK